MPQPSPQKKPYPQAGAPREYAVESAKLFWERVHFVGFINEQSYSQREMRTRKFASYLPNPSLFKSREEALEAFRKYPLKALDLTL